MRVQNSKKNGLSKRGCQGIVKLDGQGLLKYAKKFLKLSLEYQRNSAQLSNTKSGSWYSNHDIKNVSNI